MSFRSLKGTIKSGAAPVLTTEQKYRNQILTYLYGPTGRPVVPAPDATDMNHTPAYPYNVYTVSSPNLIQIDRYHWTLASGIGVYAYHYRTRVGAKKYLAISHEGHSYFNLTNHEYHIQRLLNLGYDVCLVQMPFKFTDPSPPANPDPAGILGHDAWCFDSETGDPGFVRTFFTPALAAKKRLTELYSYEKFIVIGLSGGGWTSTWLGALFPEFSATFCVAGTAQFDIFYATGGFDYEQIAKPWNSKTARPVYAYLPEDYVDLYAMAADGKRFMRVVHIDDEIASYFPSSGKHDIIGSYIAHADARSDGTVSVAFDTTQSTHEISNYTGDLIISDLVAQNLLSIGPTGATVAEPIFTNPIAWYRGDVMSPDRMTDHSRNGNHAVQASAGSQATFVASDPHIKQPCLAFAGVAPDGGGIDANDDYYVCSSVKVDGSDPSAYTEYSIFGVIKVNNPAVSGMMLLTATDSSGTTRSGPVAFVVGTDGGKIGFGINHDALGPNFFNQEWIWFVGTHVAGARKMYINGKLAHSDVEADSCSAITKIGIGRSIDGTPFWPFTGRIAELGFLGHAMTDGSVSVGQTAGGEIGTFGVYIRARYGL